MSKSQAHFPMRMYTFICGLEPNFDVVDREGGTQKPMRFRNDSQIKTNPQCIRHVKLMIILMTFRLIAHIILNWKWCFVFCVLCCAVLWCSKSIKYWQAQSYYNTIEPNTHVYIKANWTNKRQLKLIIKENWLKWATTHSVAHTQATT